HYQRGRCLHQLLAPQGGRWLLSIFDSYGAGGGISNESGGDIGMSTSSHSFPKPPQGPDVLGELLHSLSQPLTSLRCSLELSIEEVAEPQQGSVSVALQQTEKVIGMIQLMREYLDAEQPVPETCRVPLMPVLRSVIKELSSIAAVRDIQLRLALQYLIGALIEAQPRGGKVMLLVGEGPAGAMLRAADEHEFRKTDGRDQRESATKPLTNRRPSGATATSTLRRVKLAIASRVLETVGASLVFGDGNAGRSVDTAGFILRIPYRVAPIASRLQANVDIQLGK